MITATRRFQFCAGHRVFMHESKCRNLHGHNYILHLTVAASNGQDKLGRVMDYSEIKKRMGDWIDTNWDHGFIFYQGDEVIRDMFEIGGVMHGHKAYALPENPTAENMAKYLLMVIAPSVFEGTGIFATEVTLEETENCSATVNYYMLHDKGDQLATKIPSKP